MLKGFFFFRWRMGILGMLLLSVACGGETPQKECTRNGECAKLSQQCDTQEGRCVEIVCAQDADCRGGWRCESATKRCQDASCQVDSDCASTERCRSNRCEPRPECERDNDCTDPAKPRCKSNACAAECEQDTDCSDPARPICKLQRCFPAGVDCLEDQDCTDAAAPRCLRGICRPTDGCETSADCASTPTTPLCKEGRCVVDNRPKEGEACDNNNPCRDGFSCLPDDIAKKDLCQIPCVVFQPQCDGAKVCRQINGNEGACVARNNGGQSGDPCDPNAPCERDLICTLWKEQRRCASLCDPTRPRCGTKEECFEADKGIFTCVEERDPCGPGRPCPENFTCTAGRCNPPLPCDRISCPADEICVEGEGRCRKKRCPNEISCPALHTCDEGVCKPPPVDDPPCQPCNPDGTCANPNSICLGGLGNDPDDRFCIDRCASGTCNDTQNFRCQQITLTGGACSFGQCPSGFICDANTNTCVQNNVPLCMPTIGSCRNRCKNVSCSQGQVCVPSSGRCVLPGSRSLCQSCTDNLECGDAGDLCLNYPSGMGTFCGKDCRFTPCPTGYACFNVGTERQCARVNASGTLQSCP